MNNTESSKSDYFEVADEILSHIETLKLRRTWRTKDYDKVSMCFQFNSKCYNMNFVPEFYDEPKLFKSRLTNTILEGICGTIIRSRFENQKISSFIFVNAVSRVTDQLGYGNDIPFRSKETIESIVSDIMIFLTKEDFVGNIRRMRIEKAKKSLRNEIEKSFNMYDLTAEDVKSILDEIEAEKVIKS